MQVLLSTLLIRFITRGHIKRMRIQADAGADVNAAVKYLGAPLIEAINCGHIEIMKILIDAGADVIPLPSKETLL